MWKKTNSTLFLLRPIGLINKKEAISDVASNSCAARIKYGLQNAYISDRDHPTLIERPVFVLFKPSELTSFNNDFLQEEYNDTDSGLMEDYDYPEGNIVLLYKFPEAYEKDYDLLMEGKYSKVSDGFKQIFPITEENLYGRVFGRDKKLRRELEKEYNVILDDDMELWSTLNQESEILNIEKILKYAK